MVYYGVPEGPPQERVVVDALLSGLLVGQLEGLGILCDAIICDVCIIYIYIYIYICINIYIYECVCVY